MTHPMATSASYLPLVVSCRATTGNLNARSTRALRTSFVDPPFSAQAVVAPFSRLETIKSLKRSAAIATLRPRATTSPSTMREESIEVELNRPHRHSFRFLDRTPKYPATGAVPTAPACVSRQDP